MVGTLKIGKHQVYLLGFFKSMRLLPNTPCPVLQNKMAAERRNQALMDMVSMRSNINLPQFLWIEALKTVVYIIN